MRFSVIHDNARSCSGLRILPKQPPVLTDCSNGAVSRHFSSFGDSVQSFPGFADVPVFRESDSYRESLSDNPSVLQQRSRNRCRKEVWASVLFLILPFSQPGQWCAAHPLPSWFHRVPSAQYIG